MVVRGRVQGVWFRAWTEREAGKLGLDGWVRNLSDGSVEAAFSGPPEFVEEMLLRCNEGPPAARVSAVEISEMKEPIAPGFRQLPTL